MSQRSLSVEDSVAKNPNGSIEGSDDLPSVKIQMPKSITLVNAITITTGSIIGSGIFISPTGIIKESGSFGSSIIIWVFCGFLSLSGCYCYAELALMIPKSGGDYSYVMEAYGKFFGFIRLWIEVMIVRPCAITIISLVFGINMLTIIFPTCTQPLMAVRILASLCILFLGFVNAISVRLSAHIQDIFTYVKVGALILIIITGFVQLGRGFTESFNSPFEGSTTNPGKISAATLSGMFAYTGWNYLGNMTEEMINVRRNFPLAVIVSCLLITAIYTLANIAYVTVISPAELLTEPAVAITFARRIYGPVWWIMPIFVACSTFGGVNGTIMTTSRMFYSASQEGQMPSLLCFLNLDRKTPIPAVLFTCVLSLVYLGFEDVFTLINYTGIIQWLAISASVAIVIIFRIRRPNVERPVKAPIGLAVFFILSVLLVVIFAFVGSPQEALMGVAVTASGIPVYIVTIAWKNKPKVITRNFTRFTILCQKLLRLVPADRS